MSSCYVEKGESVQEHFIFICFQCLGIVTSTSLLITVIKRQSPFFSILYLKSFFCIYMQYICKDLQMFPFTSGVIYSFINLNINVNIHTYVCTSVFSSSRGSLIISIQMPNEQFAMACNYMRHSDFQWMLFVLNNVSIDVTSSKLFTNNLQKIEEKKSDLSIPCFIYLYIMLVLKSLW